MIAARDHARTVGLDLAVGFNATPTPGKDRLNITGYSHFCLRDADSGTAESLYYAFGLLRTDYTPKPAFAGYRAACRV